MCNSEPKEEGVEGRDREEGADSGGADSTQSERYTRVDVAPAHCPAAGECGTTWTTATSSSSPATPFRHPTEIR